jgi:hypothetical protein
MGTAPGPGAGDITHCEWCGAEYPADAPRPPRRPPAPTQPSAAVAPTGGEPATHCEWCGAEYPIPGESRAPEA